MGRKQKLRMFLALVAVLIIAGLVLFSSNELKLDYNELTMEIDDECQLTVERLGADKITWSSSDKNIATVTEDGVVRALAPGTARIVATAADLEAVCTVTVAVPEVEAISLNPVYLNMVIGERAILQPDVYPPEADSGLEWRWQSADTGVAVVSDGEITAVGQGGAEVTAQVGRHEVSLYVNVYRPVGKRKLADIRLPYWGAELSFSPDGHQFARGSDWADPHPVLLTDLDGNVQELPGKTTSHSYSNTPTWQQNMLVYYVLEADSHENTPPRAGWGPETTANWTNTVYVYDSRSQAYSAFDNAPLPQRETDVFLYNDKLYVAAEDGIWECKLADGNWSRRQEFQRDRQFSFNWSPDRRRVAWLEAGESLEDPNELTLLDLSTNEMTVLDFGTTEYPHLIWGPDSASFYVIGEQEVKTFFLTDDGVSPGPIQQHFYTGAGIRRGPWVAGGEGRVSYYIGDAIIVTDILSGDRWKVEVPTHHYSWLPDGRLAVIGEFTATDDGYFAPMQIFELDWQ